MVDHLAMKEAHLRAVQHEASVLRRNNSELTVRLTDSEILLDSIATSLRLLLDSTHTSKDVEEAEYAYSLWLSRRQKEL